MLRRNPLVRSLKFRPHLMHSSPLSLNTRYIIDTDIGGDIDDSLALLVALRSHSRPLGITTTHIDPEEKARIAKTIVTKCGFPHIRVYSGMGAKRTDSKRTFLRDNSLFPKAFGFPNPSVGDKKWYEKQGVAYRKNFQESFQRMKIETESAPEFIAKTAKQFSPDNKLTVVTLGPLHNIAAALKYDSSIRDNIRMISMGGVYPKGYNWLISPETSAFVLSQIETICITSEFIARNNLSLTQENLQELESSARSLFAKIFIMDWKNWHKGDVFGKKGTFLYDPVTLYLALNPDEIVSSVKKRITFPCLNWRGKLKPELRGCWYYKTGLEDKIIQVKDDQRGNVSFVEQVRSPDKIKCEIYNAIKKILASTGVRQDLNQDGKDYNKLDNYYNNFFVDPCRIPKPAIPAPLDDYYNEFFLNP